MKDVIRKRARFNWHVAYSLHNNPQLRAKRKHFLDQLKARMAETHERIENEKKILKESMKAQKANGKVAKKSIHETTTKSNGVS